MKLSFDCGAKTDVVLNSIYILSRIATVLNLFKVTFLSSKRNKANIISRKSGSRHGE